MSSTRILAIVLIVGGVLALVYGGFSYTKSQSTTELGPITIEVKDKRHVAVPIWAGVAGVVIGSALLLFPVKRT